LQITENSRFYICLHEDPRISNICKKNVALQKICQMASKTESQQHCGPWAKGFSPEQGSLIRVFDILTAQEPLCSSKALGGLWNSKYFQFSWDSPANILVWQIIRKQASKRPYRPLGARPTRASAIIAISYYWTPMPLRYST